MVIRLRGRGVYHLFDDERLINPVKREGIATLTGVATLTADGESSPSKKGALLFTAEFVEIPRPVGIVHEAEAHVFWRFDAIAKADLILDAAGELLPSEPSTTTATATLVKRDIGLQLLLDLLDVPDFQ